MIEENPQNELTIRRFLLGEMPADERTAFEKKFIADEHLFDETRVVEDELIENYVREMLSAADREKFERSFLATEPRRRRVAFARTMLDKLSEKTVVAEKIETVKNSVTIWDSVANLFKTPQLAFGAAFALLVLIFGGWLLSRNSNQPEIVQQNTPSPTLEIVQSNQTQNSLTDQLNLPNVNANRAEKSAANKNTSINVNRESPNGNQNSNTAKPNAVGIAPVLALFAGTVRSTGKMPELILPKNAPGINLQLNLESRDYKIYRVEIVNPDGNLVFHNNRLIAGSSKINFFVPAAKLRQGDYMVKLSALNSQNEDESVADYTFRVNRK